MYVYFIKQIIDIFQKQSSVAQLFYISSFKEILFIWVIWIVFFISLTEIIHKYVLKKIFLKSG